MTSLDCLIDVLIIQFHFELISDILFLEFPKQFSMKKGRTQFPPSDFRPEQTTKPSEIDYHQDFIDNRHGYTNFIGLCAFYLSSK